MKLTKQQRRLLYVFWTAEEGEEMRSPLKGHEVNLRLLIKEGFIEGKVTDKGIDALTIVPDDEEDEEELN